MLVAPILNATITFGSWYFASQWTVNPNFTYTQLNSAADAVEGYIANITAHTAQSQQVSAHHLENAVTTFQAKYRPPFGLGPFDILFYSQEYADYKNARYLESLIEPLGAGLEYAKTRSKHCEEYGEDLRSLIGELCPAGDPPDLTRKEAKKKFDEVRRVYMKLRKADKDRVCLLRQAELETEQCHKCAMTLYTKAESSACHRRASRFLRCPRYSLRCNPRRHLRK